MKIRNQFAITLLSILAIVVGSDVFSQTADPLIGRWEGVHYYGDTTRLYDGRMIVRATTIDSMKMILIIERLQEGQFTGKLHEHFYSDPSGSYFKADVSGSIKDGTIHFSSFTIKENKLPAGNRWCKPKATGVIVRREELFLLHMSFESTLTCTVGPAILERKVSPEITSTLSEPLLPPRNTNESPPKSQDKLPYDTPQHDSTLIIETFRKRRQAVNAIIAVQSDSVRIDFLDNGTVDGDSISIFVNSRLEVAHVRLTTTVFSIYVQFEEERDDIEVAMFAENLGSLPPNTALMQVVDGKKVHRAYLSSDITSNAVIKIQKSR